MNKEAREKKISKEELLAKFRATLVALKWENRAGKLVETHRIKYLKKEIARLILNY